MEMPDELRKEFTTLPQHFFGSVEIAIQDGQPVVIKTTATKKIQRERDNRHDNQSYR